MREYRPGSVNVCGVVGDVTISAWPERNISVTLMTMRVWTFVRSGSGVFYGLQKLPDSDNFEWLSPGARQLWESRLRGYKVFFGQRIECPVVALTLGRIDDGTTDRHFADVSVVHQDGANAGLRDSSTLYESELPVRLFWDAPSTRLLSVEDSDAVRRLRFLWRVGVNELWRRRGCPALFDQQLALAQAWNEWVLDWPFDQGQDPTPEQIIGILQRPPSVARLWEV